MFKEGDEVVWFNRETMNLIPGKVTRIQTGLAYPVIVRTKGLERTFTQEGKEYEEHLLSTLFHKGTSLSINEAPEPKRLPDLKVDDNDIIN